MRFEPHLTNNTKKHTQRLSDRPDIDNGKSKTIYDIAHMYGFVKDFHSTLRIGGIERKGWM